MKVNVFKLLISLAAIFATPNLGEWTVFFMASRQFVSEFGRWILPVNFRDSITYEYVTLSEFAGDFLGLLQLADNWGWSKLSTI